jgi:hypothetical protein
MNLTERFNKMLTCPDGVTDWKPEYYTVLQMEGRSMEDALEEVPPRLYIDIRDHLVFFRSVAKGDVPEIGTDVGNSTTAFLLGVEENGGTVTSIDINPQCAKNFLGHPLWTFILGSSQSGEVRDQLQGRMFDVLLVDGDHSYEGAANDITTYAPQVRQGGLILVHDVLSAFPGVRRAFDEANFGTKTILPGSWGLGVIRHE